MQIIYLDHPNVAAKILSEWLETKGNYMGKLSSSLTRLGMVLILLRLVMFLFLKLNGIRLYFPLWD